MFRNEIGFADERLPVETVAVVDVGHQVFDVERAADVVDVFFVDGEPGKARFDDRAFDRFRIRPCGRAP